MEVVSDSSYSAIREGDIEQQQSGVYSEEEGREGERSNDDVEVDLFLDGLEVETELFKGDLLLLTEGDVPGASLNGKNPGELNVVQLRRWLACRGAPITGKKPELIERVKSYIKYGWDKLLVDPDNGENCRRKLATVPDSSSVNVRLFHSVPDSQDAHWTNRLYNLPKITFGTIYDYLVDRKVILNKVSCLESMADKRAEALQQRAGIEEVLEASGDGVPVEYTRTLDKAYRFFQDGHVQNIKYHPLPTVPDHVCVTTVVLPSMRKDRVYSVTVFIHESAHVAKACCSCPAGLSGCCNHVTATLYCLEDYIHSGLQEDEQKGCTERLQTWNKPRKLDAEPRTTDSVQLIKMQYGVVKRPKAHRINEWDCRPVSRRIVDPNKARKLRENLFSIEQSKIAAANHAACVAQTTSEKKKAIQTKSLLESYGSSCFLQLLDDEPAPLETHLDEIKKERLARAAAQKKRILTELAARLTHVNHDHTYACASYGAIEEAASQNLKSGLPASQVIHLLYEHQVVLDAKAAAELEKKTRKQASSELWHSERKLRITASVMKEVCHRRPTTSCTAFVQKKINPKPLNTVAVRYGRTHESDAVSSYLDYHHSRGVAIELRECGLVVDVSLPWLAASPDGIVIDPTQGEGCLEVKCPLSCETINVEEACRKVTAFCLIEQDGYIHLSKSHAYFYQIQTQMHVTKCKWCDFVVWSPLSAPFVQRIEYDSVFMKGAILKAQKFYFEKFLPAVVPHIIMPSSVASSSSLSTAEESTPAQRILSRSTPQLTEASTMENSTAVKPMTLPLPAAGTALHCNPAQRSTPQAQLTCKASPDVQIVTVERAKSLSLDAVLGKLHVVKYVVKGDGSCLYHAISHQAGLISKTCRGDEKISMHLRKIAMDVMYKHPSVRLEGNLSKLEWLKRKQEILSSDGWGGDLEIRLLAIGLHRNVVVITASSDGSTFARRYPSQPPPVEKMKGGVFDPLSTEQLCNEWPCWKPAPLLLLFNGNNHYNSTECA